MARDRGYMGSSNTPGEKIIRLETQMADLKDQVQEVKTQVRGDIADLSKKMDNFIESADNKYASKCTVEDTNKRVDQMQTFARSLLIGIILAFLGVFIYLLEAHIIT